LAITAENMASIALREARFFGVRLVVEVQWLLMTNVESPGESDPAHDESKSKTKPKDK
jgi:hypothetical protein